MGYWENTTYLAHGEAPAVAAAIAELFAQEGMAHVARPAERDHVPYDPMQYATGLQNNLWGIAVFPGSEGWTVIKTAPLELLGERASGRNRMRLLDLADRTGAAGFQINLYDSTALLMVETDGHGRGLLSGYRGMSDDDPLEFHGEQLREDRIDVRFEYLPLQSHVETYTSDMYEGQRLLDNDAFARHLAQTLAGNNAAWCDNITCVDTLLCHKPLPMAGGIDLYFRWPPGDRPGDEFRAECERRRAKIAAALRQQGS
jgi:hypothetical protein